MIVENNKKSDKTFLTILADGKFHEQVEEGREGAVAREYEDENDEKKVKYELVHDSVKGIITSVSVVEGFKGLKNLNIEIDSEVISTGVKGQYGEDLLKKLPALDFSKEVTLTPYSFIPKGEDTVKKGLTIYQDGIKVESFYWDKETKTEKNGVPTVGDSSAFDSDDWTNHFNVVRKFMIKEIEKLPVFVEATKEETKEVKGF